LPAAWIAIPAVAGYRKGVHKLLLCHERRKTTPSKRFHRHFRETRAELVRAERASLGYMAYTQLHQSSRINPLYQGILLSRSPVVTALFALAQKSLRPRSWPLRRDASRAKRWDVVEEFTYASERALVEALRSPEGLRAAAALVRDQRGVSSFSVVVVAETFAVIADPAPRAQRIKHMFFLRGVPSITRAQMLDYWGTRHKVLFAQYQRALRYSGYEQLHVRSSPRLTDIAKLLGGREVPEFDGVAGVTYPGESEIALDFISPLSQVANLRLVQDELRFIHGPACSFVYGQCHPVDVS
jgi:hypothetical protein